MNLLQQPAYAALAAARPALAPRDHEFADSLLRAYMGRGWSDKQLYWAGKLAERVSAPAAAPEQVIADLGPIVALFAAARARLKRPYFLLGVSDLVLRLNIAGPNSRNAGDLYIAGEGAWGERAYYGRIDQAGCFYPGRNAAGREADIKGALARFAADPAGEAAAYGKLRGHCCFCALPLSDERSLEVGYGPKCAQNWGLPWGAKVKRYAPAAAPISLAQIAAENAANQPQRGALEENLI